MPPPAYWALAPGRTTVGHGMIVLPFSEPYLRQTPVFICLRDLRSLREGGRGTPGPSVPQTFFLPHDPAIRSIFDGLFIGSFLLKLAHRSLFFPYRPLARTLAAVDFARYLQTYVACLMSLTNLHWLKPWSHCPLNTLSRIGLFGSRSCTSM